MADDTADIPKTHSEIEKIAEAEKKAGVVDQQAAIETDAGDGEQAGSTSP